MHHCIIASTGGWIFKQASRNDMQEAIIEQYAFLRPFAMHKLMLRVSIIFVVKAPCDTGR